MRIYIGENIKRLRTEKSVTQETLADFLGVTFQSVSRWERGEGYPDITLLPLIATFFDVSTDELLGVGKACSKQKLEEYLKIYDTMKLDDISFVCDEFEKAAKEFPGDFRILVRYMQLLHEEKLFNNSSEVLASGEYKKVSKKICGAYEEIQNHCTDDSIRIWSKRIMVTHLLWKYDCICDSNGKYHTHKEFLKQAHSIAESLPAMCDSKEMNTIDLSESSEGWCKLRKNSLEELVFHLYGEMYSYCFNRPVHERIKQHEAFQNLFGLIYTESNYGKNSFNRLYNLGHLGHLYHQAGDDKKAMDYLKSAVEYAKELDEDPESTELIKRFYNHGTAHREMNASQFMKTVMTEHYPLSNEFKNDSRFKEIVDCL